MPVVSYVLGNYSSSSSCTRTTDSGVGGARQQSDEGQRKDK